MANNKAGIIISWWVISKVSTAANILQCCVFINSISVQAKPASFMSLLRQSLHLHYDCKVINILHKLTHKSDTGDGYGE